MIVICMNVLQLAIEMTHSSFKIKRQQKQQRAIILALGFLLLAVPAFLSIQISDSILENSNETALLELRDSLLRDAEHITQKLNPKQFYLDRLHEAKSKLTNNLESKAHRLEIEPGYSNNYFDEQFDQRLVKELSKSRITPLLTISTSYKFGTLFYCADEQLMAVCDDVEHFVNVISHHTMRIAIEKFDSMKQNNFEYSHDYQPPKKLMYGYPLEYQRKLFNRYISRHGVPELSQHSFQKIYSDYYGRQGLLITSDSIQCKADIHATLTTFVLKDTLCPVLILKNALKLSPNDFSREVKFGNNLKSGFINNEFGISYSFLPPTSFLNHNHFYHRFHNLTPDFNMNEMILSVSGELPKRIQQLNVLIPKIQLFIKLAIVFYLMLSYRIWLFGFSTNLKIKNKLFVILSFIILIPILFSGLILFNSIIHSNKLIFEKASLTAENQINMFKSFNNENDYRTLLAAYKIKDALQNSKLGFSQISTNHSDIIDDNDLNYLLNWFYRIHLIDQSANYIELRTVLTHPESSKLNLSPLERRPSLLLYCIVFNYMNSLHLLKIPPSEILREENRVSFTLASIEDFLTPIIEEQLFSNEMRIIRDIAETDETRSAVLFLARNLNNEHLLFYLRLLRATRYFDYLDQLYLNYPDLFTVSNDFAQIEIGAAERVGRRLSGHQWPPSSIGPAIKANIDKAMSNRATGQEISSDYNQTVYNTWVFTPGDPLILAATAKTAKDNLLLMSIEYAFPLLFILAVFILIVVSELLSKIFIKPIQIIENAVEKINKMQYGSILKSFSEDEFSHITKAYNEMSVALKQREMMKRFLSKRLYESADNSLIENKPVEVTVLCSDIRSFTSITEQHSPAEIVEMLNSYFTEMDKAISSNKGIIDKYIGDAIQAVFYHEDGLPHPALRACNAAIAMRNNLRMFNIQRNDNKQFTVENGIGIATGRVISGIIGNTAGRKDHTIVGEISSKASDYESETVNTTSKILVCEKTYSFACEKHSFNTYKESIREMINEN